MRRCDEWTSHLSVFRLHCDVVLSRIPPSPKRHLLVTVRAPSGGMSAPVRRNRNGKIDSRAQVCSNEVNWTNDGKVRRSVITKFRNLPGQARARTGKTTKIGLLIILIARKFRQSASIDVCKPHLKRKRWPGQTRKRLRRASGCRRPSFRQGKPRRLRYLSAHTALIAHYFPPAAGAATENPLSGVF
jgi:hypothetical protein